MANTMMEELEIKEPTPSLAPSQYESPLYTKKWRIVLAVLLGVTLMGLCILGFYVSVKARGAVGSEVSVQHATITAPPPLSSSAGWRINPSGASCLSLVNDTCPKEFAVPPLLVLGLDGLRPDALREDLTPALVYLRKCGATTRSLVPTYPTTTFPNMYTIATGLYPESHGVVGNRMRDPNIQKEFNLNDTESILDSAWWGGEPIWNTVMKQKKKPCIVQWPGSDVLIQERYAVYWESYRRNKTFEERINQVHRYLTLPEQERAHLFMIYFEEPMHTMREYGMDSKEAEEGLANIDKMVDELMNYLHENKIAHCVNVMVVSDHGVAPVSCSNNFYLETFMDNIKEQADIYIGGVGRLKAKKNDKKSEENILNNLRCKNPKVRARPKELLPRRYHYANNPRIENILLDTLPNTRVVTNSEDGCGNADHGYNNLEASMQATFIGFGPDFKVNQTSQSFRNVELYNLMCQLMRITPASNNGTAGSLNHLLRHPPPINTPSKRSSLHEEVLPPPDGMLEQRNPEDKCHCFTPEDEDVPTAESLVRARRSGEGISSGDSNNINDTESADNSDSNNNSSSNKNPDTTTTTSTTTPAPSTTPSTTTTTSSTTTAPSTTTPSTTTTMSSTSTTTTTTPSPNATTPSTTTTSSTTTPASTTTTTSTTTPASTTTTTTTPTTTTTIPTTTTPRGRTEAELSLLRNTHVPWGSPSLSLSEDIQGKLKVLLHSSHVIGLHETLNLGVWTSFTLTNLTVAQLEEEESLEEHPPPPVCWRADPRLERPQQDQCQRMLTKEAFDAANITLVQLFPKELETKELLAAEGYLLSNLAAVRAGYFAGAYKAMVKALKSWTTSFGAINVIHGPIFDDNLDGHQDPVAGVLNTVKPLVPTNYFFVVNQCGSMPCPNKPKETLALVFPNTAFPDNCVMTDIEYLNYHLTNVQDVELLTGLHFFSNMYSHAALEYRVSQPLEIWPLPPSTEPHILSLLSDRMGKADSFAADDTQPS